MFNKYTYISDRLGECSTHERDVESVENLSWRNVEENMSTGVDGKYVAQDRKQ